MNNQCGCERGDNCTKTTVCALESAVEDAKAEAADALEQATTDIRSASKSLHERGTRIEQLEAAIRENPCLTLVAQEVPFKDCFPAEPCEPCHCGKSLLAGDNGNG